MAEPIVTLKQGQLKGVTDSDLNGDNYFKFLGIPYAKPPIGALRFKAPHPAESWTGVRDATKEGNPCLSIELKSMKPIGSEDCLYLNVFTKQLPQGGLNLKPVMVFIHGGGFITGSGSEQMQGSKFLVSEDVVLVTINYRLGIFGFLGSDDLSLEVPGNAGLKDQTFALKWVQENISSFNGDPSNVTIFGVSAGGASVHFQVLSPTSKGLFHKAIAQSGVAFNPWAWGQKNAILVAEKLEKKISNDKDALDVLMNVHAQELLLASLKIPDAIFDSLKRRPFGPVIEKPNPTAFLTEHPRDLLISGRFNQVPLIQGFASNEGLTYEFEKVRTDNDPKPIELGACWYFDLSEEQRAKIKSSIGELYFKNGEAREEIHKLVGDVGFLLGVLEATKLAVKSSRNPVYLYVFSYETILSNIPRQLMGIKEDFKGVVHGADQMFLFNNQMGGPTGIPPLEPKVVEEAKAAVKKIIKIWADFARTGRPHPNWEPVKDLNELKYFVIDKEPTLKTNLYADRVAVWENIYKELPPIDFHLQEHATI